MKFLDRLRARLDEAAAGRVIDVAATLGVYWIKCPLPEAPAQIAPLVRLHRAANRRGVLLAGLVSAIGLAGFRPFLEAGAYVVMMPDIKYVGGHSEVLRLAEAMRAARVAFSPHNPTGPVCHAVSLQVCAALGEVYSLELQSDEPPRFSAPAGGELQAVTVGVMHVPSAPRIGMTLQSEPVAGCRSFRRLFAR